MTHARRGITRIEVAVLAAILLVLGCLAISGILSARVSARRRQCAYNLSQLALGLQTYAELHGGLFPYGTVLAHRLPPERRWSWYVGAWGFVGDGQIELLLDLDEAWDAKGNRPVRARVPLDDPPSEIEIVGLRDSRCPANPVYDDRARQDANSYVGMAGIGADAARLPSGDPKAGIWGYRRQTGLGQITDGDACTILLAETGLDCGPWMAGGPPTVRGLDPDRQPLLGPGGQFGGLHPGGCQVVMADRKVRFINDGVDPDVLLSQVTVADGGEPAPTEPPLAFRLEMDRRRWELGEDMDARLILTNVSANPLTVPDVSLKRGKLFPEGLTRSLQSGALRLELEQDGQPVEPPLRVSSTPVPSLTSIEPGGQIEVDVSLGSEINLRQPQNDRVGEYRLRAVLDTTKLQDKGVWRGRVATDWVAFTVAPVQPFRPKAAGESDEGYARAKVDFLLQRVIARKGRYFSNVHKILETAGGVPALIAALKDKNEEKRRRAEAILQLLHSPPGDQGQLPQPQEGWMKWWQHTGSKLGRDKLWHNFDSHFQ